MNFLSKDGDTMQKSTPILITGAGGFIGKNLVANLRTAGFTDLMLFEKDDTPETLAQYAARAGFVFHLAGINRPKDPSEFYAGNSGLTDVLLDLLAKAETPAPVLVTSSTQAALDNDYGKSKAMAEAAVSIRFSGRATCSGQSAMLGPKTNSVSGWGFPTPK